MMEDPPVSPSYTLSTIDTYSSVAHLTSSKKEKDDDLQADRADSTKTTLPSIDYIKFSVATFMAGAAIICLFVANLSYLYGAMYQQTSRSHELHIVMVDFDNNGSITQALLGAYQQLASPSFPTLVLHNSSEYNSTQDVVDLVKEQKFWGAIYVNAGASQRLSAAIAGNTSDYDPDAALAYVWNQVRYPAISGGVITPSLVRLVSATKTAYHMAIVHGNLNVLATIAQGDGPPTAVQALLNPIGATSINIRSADQATKGLYNTVSLAVPIVQQFFFIVAFNGISDTFGLFTRSSAKVCGAIRFVVGVLFAGGSALGTTGYLWAFREEWAVPGKVFVETWMLLWFMMHIYYLLWDTATAFLPMPAMPFIIVTFLFLSITSAISPFEVSPAFYQWGQSLPAFETLQMLWNVWSGSFVKVYQALPILFAWWTVWVVLSMLGFVRRRRLASKGMALSVH